LKSFHLYTKSNNHSILPQIIRFLIRDHNIYANPSLCFKIIQDKQN